MDWWKLFSGTFILIFLAELGDKTQLAAMAKTADSPDNSMAKWVVFLGASFALVASTCIAVFAGNFLKALVPDERYIKIAAGALFLVFGFMILAETYRSYREEKAEVVAALPEGANPGYIGRLAISAAMDFEQLAGDRYRRLAAVAENPAVARLLATLAAEEEDHLSRLRGIPSHTAGETGIGKGKSIPEVEPGELVLDAGKERILAELIRHEESTVEFYRALARRALIPSLRQVFARLAESEETHVRRLSELASRASARITGAEA